MDHNIVYHIIKWITILYTTSLNGSQYCIPLIMGSQYCIPHQLNGSQYCIPHLNGSQYCIPHH